MRSRFEILQALENIFLRVQDKITKINPGSVLKSLFYSVSVELENAYEELDDLKKNSFIATASGEYLDNLIYGFSGLKRKIGKRSMGYVFLKTVGFSFDSIESIDRSRFIFPFWDPENDTLIVYPNTPSIDVLNDRGDLTSYYILPPLRFLPFTEDMFVEVDGEQNISRMYKNFLKTIFLKTNKPITLLILPIISSDYGQDKNLLPSRINENIVFFGRKFLVKNDITTQVDTRNTTFADFDGSSKLSDDGLMVTIGENAFITGGQDRETDEEYRARFVNYINSLPRGTLDSLDFALKTFLSENEYTISGSEYPGIVNVYINSEKILNDAITSPLEQVLENYKPVGTVVNILRAKPIYFNVLFDAISSKELDVTLTENLKNEVYRKIKSEEKIQSEGIDVFKISSKILEAVSDIKEFSSVNNVYIGLTLTQQLFDKYKGKINEALQNNLSSSPAADYSSYIQKLINGDINLFVLEYDTTTGIKGSFRTPGYPKYPLKEVVKMIKSGLFDGLYTSGSGDYLRLSGLIQSIKNTCKDISDDICLRSVARQNYSGQPFTWTIKLKDIKLTNKVIYNYYYTKFLTIPIESSNDDEVCDDLGISSVNCYEEKIKMFILNDVQYERYRDIDFLRTGTYSVPKIYIDPFDDIFNVKYAIGVRILV
jgi:hypothetical protein